MKILIAEDESDTLVTYQLALKARNHDVILARNGKECLQVYNQELLKKKFEPINEMNDKGVFNDVKGYQPFDVVILDHLMPIISGMEVAKEILDKNPNQRIVFASAYIKETLEESVKYLPQPVELIEKPLQIHTFIEKIEKSYSSKARPYPKLITNLEVRDQIDIIGSILELAVSPTSMSKYTIAHGANLSYPRLKKYLDILLDYNLLLYSQNSNFKITEKGLSFLDSYNKLRALLYPSK